MLFLNHDEKNEKKKLNYSPKNIPEFTQIFTTTTTKFILSGQMISFNESKIFFIFKMMMMRKIHRNRIDKQFPIFVVAVLVGIRSSIKNGQR